ncbi:replication protein A, subunit RPA32 [Xylariaceae sp. FL0594]|nr:replication protein A, subunit RPA32 [Xylariaceae sp. FL0594]
MSGYGYNTYGAGGGEDGGGFVQWGSQAGSQGGSQSAAKPVNDESLRPVTIKQILDAEPAYSGDTSFRIDGVDVKQVTIVGMVRSISLQTTNTTYKIEDGTGVIEVKQWLDADKQQQQADDDNENSQATAIKEGQYVRVYGRLKHFNNKRHIGSHVIRPITDFNEVNYHLLEATYVHLFTTRGPPNANNNNNNNNNNTYTANANNYNSHNNDSMFVDGGQGIYNSYTPTARRVFDFIKAANAGSEGVNAHVIARELKMTVPDVIAAGEELLGYGTIYATLDDETFGILES